jgi:hypothetical protein
MWNCGSKAAFLILIWGQSLACGATWRPSTVLLPNDHIGFATRSFGSAVATDGHSVIVGAEGDNDAGQAAGAAYIFERDSQGSWAQAAKLFADDAFGNSNFGRSVAIEGNTAVVTAHFDGNHGAAYVFEKQATGNWLQAAKLVAGNAPGSGELFGNNVALHGNMLVVSSTDIDIDWSVFPTKTIRNTGAAYVFERSENLQWEPVSRLTSPTAASADLFARQISTDGNSIAISAIDPGEEFSNTPDMGMGYIYRRNSSGDWSLNSTIGPIPITSTATGVNPIAVDGDRIVVGGTGTPIPGWMIAEIAFYNKTDSGWQHDSFLQSSLDNVLGFPSSFVDLSGNVGIATTPWGPNFHPGGLTGGGVSIFEFSDEHGWTEAAGFPIEPGSQWGEVAISSEIAVAARVYDGGVYVFETVPEPSTVVIAASLVAMIGGTREYRRRTA